MITMATEEDDFERQLQLEKEEQYKQEQGYLLQEIHQIKTSCSEKTAKLVR